MPGRDQFEGPINHGNGLGRLNGYSQSRFNFYSWLSGTLLLGHTKLESIVRYLGIEVDNALELAAQTEV